MPTPRALVSPVRPTSHFRALLFAAWLLLAAPSAAHAYIDPGSGALVLQAIAASIAGSAFFLRRSLRSAWSRLRGRSAHPPSQATAGAPPEEVGGSA